MLLFFWYGFVCQIAIGFIYAPVRGAIGLLGLQALYTVILLVPPILIFFTKFRERPAEVFSFRRVSIKNVLLVIAMMILLQPLINLVSYIVSYFSPNPVSDMMDEIYLSSLWLQLFVIAVMPAVLEELFFRGIMMRYFKDVPIRTTAIITGLFFGFYHQNFQQFVYAFIIGVFFAYAVYHTRSIFVAMTAHFCFNGTNVLLSFLLRPLAVEMEPVEEAAGSEFAVVVSMIIVAAVSLAIFFLVFGYFKKINRQGTPVFGQIPQGTACYPPNSVYPAQNQWIYQPYAQNLSVLYPSQNPGAAQPYAQNPAAAYPAQNPGAAQSYAQNPAAPYPAQNPGAAQPYAQNPAAAYPAQNPGAAQPYAQNPAAPYPAQNPGASQPYAPYTPAYTTVQPYFQPYVPHVAAYHSAYPQHPQNMALPGEQSSVFGSLKEYDKWFWLNVVSFIIVASLMLLLSYI